MALFSIETKPLQMKGQESEGLNLGIRIASSLENLGREGI